MSKKRSLIDRMRDFFADIEKDILDTFGKVFEERCSWDPEERCLEPLTNQVETEEEIIITADLPYVKKDNIDLHVTDDMLDLQATLEQAVKFAQWGTVQRNTEFQKFHKHIKLSTTVDSDNITAVFKGGILEIRLPKKVTRIRIDIE